MDDFNARAQRKLKTAELAAQITELAGHLNAGEYRWLQLIAEFDRREGWSDWSTHSCAHWLNWQCGLDMGAARERVRVAHALEKLPKIAESMATGALSYSKVRAITRVACENTEEYFLSIALHGTAHHVEKLVRSYRRAKETQELSREAQQQARRGLQYYQDDDGSLILKGSLPAEIGAIFIKALEAATGDMIKARLDEMRQKGVSAETSEEKPSFAAQRADALGQLAECFLKHGAEAMSGGDRHQIVVHVDMETLRHTAAGRCELEDGPALAAETARRLACDSSVVAIVEDEEGEILNVGRKTRSIPPSIRRALNARDQGCRFPGCTHKRYVDAHHIQHWAQGGQTRASNLVTLCRFHHRKVHEGGMTIEHLGDGSFRFIKPDGSAINSVCPGRTEPMVNWTALVSTHGDLGIRIDRNTAATGWRGERMDYGLAIECLIHRSLRRRDVSAETSVAEPSRIQRAG